MMAKNVRFKIKKYVEGTGEGRGPTIKRRGSSLQIMLPIFHITTFKLILKTVLPILTNWQLLCFNLEV